MKLVKIILVIIFSFSLVLPNYGQDNSATPQRTPEQEAAKQTEKLQQELNLSQEQARQLYEINLKYARERQISNTRSEAMERMKNKNADIEKILNAEQNNRLQSKRYERSGYDNTPSTRSLPAGASGLRSSEYRSTPIQRTPATDNILRNSYRPTTREYSRPSSEQTQRQSSPPSRTPNSNNYQPPRRSTSEQYSTPRRSEPTPSRQAEPASRQSTPSSGSRRTETPASSGRR